MRFKYSHDFRIQNKSSEHDYGKTKKQKKKIWKAEVEKVEKSRKEKTF